MNSPANTALRYRDTDRGWLRLKADLAWWRTYGDNNYSSHGGTFGARVSF